MGAKSQTTLLAEYQALLTGLPKYWPNGVFNLSGTAYTVAQIVDVVTGLVAAMNLVMTKKMDLESARTALLAAQAAGDSLVEGAKEVLALQFKNAPTTLAALGVTPRKTPAPLTAEVLAAKVVKARATRQARGTTSKKQKAQITGNVSGVTITPVTTSEPAPTAAAGGATAAGTNGASTPVASATAVPGPTRS
jgi:hypothetical protein